MGDVKEFISEKSINYWIRLILRFMAWITLVFFMVYKIIIPIKTNVKIDLGEQEVNLMIACISLLLAIEGVKLVVDKWLVNRVK